MLTQPKTKPQYLLQHSRWMFVAGSLIAAVVALLAEGLGDFIGLAMLCVCVGVVCMWSLTNKLTIYWAVGIIFLALLTLGWTVEDPESALFQAILIGLAVGWRVDRLSHSLGLLALLTLLPLLGEVGPHPADWAWWNWSVGTLLIWWLGRTIRLLEYTLNELTDARSQLIDSAAREERLRISRDVHDLVGHSLTAMLLNIRAAQRALGTDQEEAHQALSDAERTATTGITEIRTALVDLRDETFDHEKCSNATYNDQRSSPPDGEAVLQLLQQQSHIKVSTSGKVASLQGPVAITVYRILQECITNCTKYAQQGTAVMSLDVGPHEVNLSSRNALRETIKTTPTISDRTLGLISMRERANSLGGVFNAGVDGDDWQVDCRLPRND